MKQRLIINGVFILSILIVISGCATTSGGKGSTQPAVITAIDIVDNQLNVIVDKPFTYTVYKSSDPYKVIVELPDVRLGIFADRIKSDKAGITEIIPSQIDEPLSTKLEILLVSPVAVEPVYKDMSLAIKVKDEAEATSAEPAVETTKEEGKEASAEKAAEPVKEVKWEDADKPKEAAPEEPAAAPLLKEEPAAPETKPITAAAPEEKKEKEEPIVIKPEPRPIIPKEIPSATSIVGINVEKADGDLKVVIKGNGSLNPTVFRLDNRAVLDIPNVQLNASVPASVPLPLKNIRAGKHRGKLRLVLDMKEGTNFDVAALEESVIVAFRLSEKAVKEKYIAKEKYAATETKTAAVPEKSVEGKYKGQKISLDFQDADIGPIFRLMADISGYNFVIDPAVKGKITMKLMNVPWDQALDIILQTFNLGKTAEGNIMWIAPLSMFAKMAEEKSKAKDVEEKAEDLYQEIVRINYATAADVSKAISDGKLLSSRGSVTKDERMNTLIIKDTQKSINRVKELVKIMDVSKPQVMIEAKIVEVSSNYTEQLGIKWGGSYYTQTYPNSLGSDFSVNTPIASAGPTALAPGGVLGLTIGAANTLNINMSLSALETIGKSKKLSSPKVMTMDNEKAEIQQGTSIPVQTTSAEGTKTEFVNATLKLEVTPKITPDGFIQMKIEANNDSLGILTPQGYAIEKKSVKTNALIKNGDTLVIGGIYTTSATETETGVPLLSKIPLLGWLFKTKTQAGPNITELLIFITPSIVSKAL